MDDDSIEMKNNTSNSRSVMSAEQSHNVQQSVTPIIPYQPPTSTEPSQSLTQIEPAFRPQPEVTTKQPKTPKELSIHIILVGLATVALIVTAIVFIIWFIGENTTNGGSNEEGGSNNSVISRKINVDDVKRYCEDNNMQTTEYEKGEEPSYILGLDQINTTALLICEFKSDTSSLEAWMENYIYLIFVVADEPFLENEQLVSGLEKNMSSVGILERSDNYLKYYESASSGVQYVIIDDNATIQLSASDNNLAKKTLIGIGYPDRNWASENDSK